MDKKMYRLMNWPAIEAIVYSEECHPYDLLGPETVGNQTLVQTFQPGAGDVFLYDEKNEEEIRMECVDEEGYYAAFLPGRMRREYHFTLVDPDGTERDVYDAYAYRPRISPSVYKRIQLDMRPDSADLLGAHKTVMDGVSGYLFTVFAPNALRVSVVGPFNRWDGRVHPMQKIEEYGIHVLFIPGLESGTEYMYEIKKHDRSIVLKADPYELMHTVRPGKHSVTADLTEYPWTDRNYLEMKQKQNVSSFPVNILKFHPAMMNQMPEFAADNRKEQLQKVIAYAKQMSYTHIALMATLQHPYDETLGYEVIGFYAPNSLYWKPEELQAFVDECHKKNIGVLIDLPIARFPKDDFGLCEFDGSRLYEYTDTRKAEKADGATRLFNLARYEVRNYLLGSAYHWLTRYHVDGLCLNDLSSVLFYDYDRDGLDCACNMYGGHENLEAADFLRRMNQMIHKQFPYAVMIAQEPAGFPGVTDPKTEQGLHFDLKCNLGMTKGLVDYMAYDPYFRKHHHTELTDLNIYQFCENYVISMDPLAADCGDCSVLDRMPGDGTEQYANLRAAYAYMMLQPGKKGSFPAQVLSDKQPWNMHALYEEQKDCGKQFATFVAALNDFYLHQPALYEQDHEERGFRWINTTREEENILTWERISRFGRILVVAHMGNILRKNVVIGVPENGKYKAIFSTDLPEFGGSGNHVKRIRPSVRTAADGQKYSIKMNLAPLSITAFSMIPYTEEELEKQIETEKQQLARQRDARKLAMVRKRESEKRTLAKQREAEKQALARRKEAEKLALMQKKAREKVRLSQPSTVKTERKQPSGKQGGK